MSTSDVARRVLTAAAAMLLVGPLAAAARAADDVSETRPVPAFDRIQLDGAFRVEITAGAPQTRVTISAARDTVARVTTEVMGRTLRIGMKPGISLDRAPRVTIALPDLRGFVNQGAGSADIRGLAGGDVEIENAGAASIAVAGRATRETIRLNGTGKIDARAVDAHDVRVDNNGVGAVYVRAAGSLVMNVNGLGEIRYAGTPANIESHVNGIGRIGRL